MSKTAAIWKKRIAQWRASGETAERFSRRHGFAGQTLKWWAWRLARGSGEAPVIRVAQVVRARPVEPAQVDGAIVVDYLDRRVRVTVGRGAEERLAAAIIGQLEGGAK
jgi:hypothetical protein